jgi:hypothetical protein
MFQLGAFAPRPLEAFGSDFERTVVDDRVERKHEIVAWRCHETLVELKQLLVNGSIVLG